MNGLFDRRERDRRYLVGQGVECFGVLIGEEIGPAGEQLAHLHEAGPEFHDRREEPTGPPLMKGGGPFGGAAPE